MDGHYVAIIMDNDPDEFARALADRLDEDFRIQYLRVDGERWKCLLIKYPDTTWTP